MKNTKKDAEYVDEQPDVTFGVDVVG